MFHIAAINDVDTSRDFSEPLAPTKEAQESRLTQMYGEALSHLQHGQIEKAQSLFQSILQDPISIKAQVEPVSSANTMLQLRYSALKNLAETFSMQGSGHHVEAVDCFLQAAAIDGKDVVLWNRLGTLSCALGNLNVARRAFEEGLRCSPRHWSCMEKLVEILIAVGDESACLSVAKRLLKLSPSHPRALQIQHAIEQGVSMRPFDGPKSGHETSSVLKIGPRGFDLLQPEYFGLSFDNKRKLENAYETVQHQKKRKVHSIDVHLPEASWFALVNAVTDVLKGGRFWKDDEPSLNTQIVVSPGGNQSEQQKAASAGISAGLVNATVKFSVHKSHPIIVDLNSEYKEQVAGEEAELISEDCLNSSSTKTSEEVSREGLGVAPVLAEPRVESASENRAEGHKDVENASVHQKQQGTGEKQEASKLPDLMKPSDPTTEWDQPSQERRSTRLEKLRSCRRLDKEGEGFSHSSDPARALKKALEPFVIYILDPSTNVTEESLSAVNPKSISGSNKSAQAEGQQIRDGGQCIKGEEEKAVLRFLNEVASNSGIFHVAQQLLERVVASGPSQRKSLSWLLFLEKLTRMWAAERSAACSLFLAEVYMDMATSATNDTTASKCFHDCNYNVCRLIENATSRGTDDKERMASAGVDSNLGSNGVTEKSEVDSMEIASGRVEFTNCLQDLLTSVQFPTNSKLSSNLSPIDLSPLDVRYDWSFWARFHWLSGRLWVHSGQWEQAHREFERCQSILEYHERTGSCALIFLPHCKLDKEISLDRVHGKLHELRVENILKHSAAKLLEKGQYEDLIRLLKPVLLGGNDRSSNISTSGSDDPKRGDASVSSHELKGLEMLITACENIKPPNLVLGLQCRELRLRLLSRAAGLAEVKIGDDNDSSFTTLDTEVDVTQATPSGPWSKLVAEEIHHISHGAALLSEKLEGPEGYKSLSPVLGRTQLLLLTLMCHFVQTLSHRKGNTGVANLSLNTQAYSSCFVDAAIAFCRLQHLQPSVPLEHQVTLLVTLHDVLAEYGLCCAGKDSEGGEGGFLKMSIKHLGALESRLKPQNVNKSPAKAQINEPIEKEIVIDDDVMIIEKSSSRPIESSEVADKEKSGNDSKGISLVDENHEEEAMDIEKKREELGIDYALDQSFFCLYGLNLRGEATGPDGLMEHQNTNRGDYKTMEQCAGVLQYILPYAKACSRAGLMKLKKVLRAIHKQFSCPPPDVLSEKSVDMYLEDPDFDEDKLRDMVKSGTSAELVVNFALHSKRREGFASSKSSSLVKIECETPATSKASSASPSCKVPERSLPGASAEKESVSYTNVYENLYYLVAQIEDMSASDKWPGFVLTKEGEEFVQTNANYFKYDLCYNPLRFESWLKLAKILDEEVDLLLNDGSKNINVVEWRKTGILASRVELSRRQSRRSLLMALALAVTPDQKSEVNELLALVYYDSIQNVVPSYDQRRHVPVHDASWIAACQNSFAHFEVAYSYKPHWTHVFYCGKLVEKLEQPHSVSLAYYKKGIDMNPTAVDPLYRLHASRFKLLCCSRHSDKNILQVVGQYCFLPSTLDKVENICKAAVGVLPDTSGPVGEFVVVSGEGSVRDGADSQVAVTGKATAKFTITDLKEDVDKELLNQVWNTLFDDCAAALQSCFDGELKHFHKARYRLALGLHCRGEDHDLERAKEELAFCFKTHRSLFTINMWEIDESHLRKSRKKPAHQRVLELGMPESSRKFISCVRKYLIFYLTLCEEAEDLGTLERAYTCLKADRKFSLCLEDISRVALGKYILALARAICQTDSEGSTSQTLLHPLLEKMFNLYMDFGISWSDSAGLSLAEAGIMNSPEVAESAIYSYTHRYIQLLEADKRVDALEVVNERIRKRFKNPKLVGAQSGQVCKHASFAWCRALCTALCSITTISQDTVLKKPWSIDQGLEERKDQEQLLIVDLQDEFMATSSYEMHTLPTLSQHPLVPTDGLALGAETSMSTVGTSTSPTLSGSYSLIKSMKNVLVKQASTENLDKATALLRSAYVFYRDSFSGPFPSGINLYLLHPSKMPSRGEGSTSTLSGGSQAGCETLDISTPRKLLMWAFTLVHGRTGVVAEAVKYCEEQAKPRLKKGPSSLSQGSAAAAAAAVTIPISSGIQEKTVTTEKTNISLSKHLVSQSPLPAEADRSWAPMDVDPPTAPASAVSPPALTPHEGHAGPVYAATAIGGSVQNTVANVTLSPRPLSTNPSPSGLAKET
ncbi:calcineurin-binding protein 1 isoform X1 [Physcomitrium patens]|uniref:Uncharacterized protein n=2 Tax=Physcomitrium patens TaxID=3218 RepID=A0A2K1KLV5_PHYPA|nr:uncharacterized protein LOC112281241 isoform X1 [Physcomitrium patens]PNR54751.1 hypothetical protein PHYPA_005644 [Physcomitrium patens]|eukprot:XP_024373289.1 uncharacterized protein LOC112281241 isoform X1 [Physcomitrella patens]